ncbi:putative permease SEO1 [Sugiyamaella lignohabitans]|uniref:Putative permease SEO1 n=1 Tax=Sugiyamaella lignohabitans TaxID=796027 RepID=A0A161HL86_9ASCO|nr:putative permease SEO1 [Sugiyamaella lignohabitans]ANB14007.1 putative permease SEO1 [Sugiyamaella lignohabitans]
MSKEKSDQLAAEPPVVHIPEPTVVSIPEPPVVHIPVQGDDELLRENAPTHWYDSFVRMVNWYPKHISKDERRLLIKVDFVLLSYVCISYFCKALEKSNITNAYVSGMKEDIDFGGNDLSYAKSLYSAGYIVSMCLGTMFVTRDWARLMLPVLEITWGVLSACESAVTNSSQMFALRFLIGFAEGPIFPSVLYIIGSWYNRDERYRRIMAFSVSSSLGGMFSGYLQSAAYGHLQGVGGHTGWQWGFIIDGAVIAIPLGVIGIFIFPGTPQQAKNVWWLKKSDIQLAVDRTIRNGVATPTKLNWSIVKRTLLRWHVHFFATFWVLLNIVALPDGTGFPLWLKSQSPERFSVAQVNNYPTIASAVGVVAQFLIAGFADSYPVYPFLSLCQVLFIISYSSLAAWDIPDGWRWVCFLIVGFDGVNQMLVSGWINDVTKADAEERAFVLGYSDAVSQAINIWTNIVFFPTEDAPKFHLGYIISTVGAILMLFLPILGYFGERWDKKHNYGLGSEVLVERSTGKIEATTSIAPSSALDPSSSLEHEPPAYSATQ